MRKEWSSLPDRRGPQLANYSQQKNSYYPAFDYIGNLSERTRGHATQQYWVATENLKFVIFVKDSENNRLRSYVYDMP